jgi:hypothetical protein
MRAGLAFSILVAVTFGAGVAWAGTPFGGDNTGFVPPDQASSACEDGVAKEVSKLKHALITCNIKDSDRHVRNVPFDGAACQAGAQAKYDARASLLSCTGPAACVDRPGIRDLTWTLANLIDTGGVVFCDNASGVPQDPPDSGYVPSNQVVQKCEDSVARTASKLFGAITKCHIKVADMRLKGRPFDEEGCETKAKSKYDVESLKVTGCPLCLGAPGRAALRDLVETLLDSNNGLPYCASPSGAFPG